VDIILHIGAPKTGSTAIQQAFWTRRRALAGAGILYPTPPLGRNNHSILTVGLVTRANLARHMRFGHPDAELWLNRKLFMARLRSELARTRPAVLFLSAEDIFATADVAAPLVLLDELQTLGPARLRVAVFVRKPSGWFASAQAQYVRAAGRFAAYPLPIFAGRLEAWIAAAGDAQVDILATDTGPGPRPGSLETLLGHYPALGPARAVLAGADQPTNPTLSAESVAVMMAFRRHFFPRSDGELRRSCGPLAKALLRIDRDLGLGPARCHPGLARLIDAGSGDLHWLRDRRGIVYQGHDYDAPPPDLAALDPPAMAPSDCLILDRAACDGVVARLAAMPWANRFEWPDSIAFGVTPQAKRRWLSGLHFAGHSATSG
jgi:hypothetical protein